jgi:hypothetical protein
VFDAQPKIRSGSRAREKVGDDDDVDAVDAINPAVEDSLDGGADP